MPDLVVNGVSVILIVFGLVEFAKSLGASGNPLRLLSMGIGTALYSGYQLTLLYPEAAPFYGVLVYGLGGGLAACGLYSFSKRFMPGQQGKQ